MIVNDLQAELIEYAKTIGIDKIGFTSAAPFIELKNLLVSSGLEKHLASLSNESLAMYLYSFSSIIPLF